MNQEHLKLKEGFRTYLKLKEFKDRGIADKLRFAGYLFSYIEENGLELSCLRRQDAESYREHLATLVDGEGKPRYRAESINGMISGLRLMFKYLMREGIAKANPFLEVERMKQSARLPKSMLSIEEMGKLLENIEVKDQEDLKFKTAVEVLYATGCRISELEGLCLKDIDFSRGIITIRDDKDRKDRLCALTEYAERLLKIYLTPAKGDKPFRHGKDRGLNKFMNIRLKRLCRKLELPIITCHGIRHSAATHLLKKGADLREVQEYLGHRLIKNTEVYTHLAHEDLKKVIEELHPRERRE